LARAMRQPDKLAVLIEPVHAGIPEFLRPAIRKAGYRVTTAGTAEGFSVFTISPRRPR
jgi:hypothetical protein